MAYTRRILPYALFMNGSGNRFQDATAIRNDVIQLIRDYGVSKLYVPMTPDVLPKVKAAILKANSAQSQPDQN